MSMCGPGCSCGQYVEETAELSIEDFERAFAAFESAEARKREALASAAEAIKAAELEYVEREERRQAYPVQALRAPKLPAVWINRPFIRRLDARGRKPFRRVAL